MSAGIFDVFNWTLAPSYRPFDTELFASETLVPAARVAATVCSAEASTIRLVSDEETVEGSAGAGTESEDSLGVVFTQ